MRHYNARTTRPRLEASALVFSPTTKATYILWKWLSTTNTWLCFLLHLHNPKIVAQKTVDGLCRNPHTTSPNRFLIFKSLRSLFEKGAMLTIVVKVIVVIPKTVYNRREILHSIFRQDGPLPLQGTGTKPTACASVYSRAKSALARSNLGCYTGLQPCRVSPVERS